MMGIGAEWTVFMPSYLAYEGQGMGDKIPGMSTLVFEMKIVDVDYTTQATTTTTTTPLDADDSVILNAIWQQESKVRKL